ncbi:MAG: hypothetical protein J0L87_03190 [Bacteroidetes bacterium]|nr:hypothetical protein [Bacteroidota bacterium]
MFSLTEEQIAFIENDIKIRGITSPDLSIDLLDHICCLIENELDEYRNFDTVYLDVLTRFGEKGLKEIQLETNRLLTFKHYYIMNSTMKISGYVSSLLILSGAIFKFNHWPGASIMMVTGVFFLTVLCLPLLFILKFKSTAESNRSILLSIIAFVSAIAISSGVLFRIMHWPGARMLTVTGCALLVLGYLPVYLLSVYKNTTNKINATATIILIIAGAGLFIVESGTGLTKEVSDSFWRGVTENQDLLNFIKSENSKTYELIKKDTGSVSQSKIEKAGKLEKAGNTLSEYISSMRTNLIAATENISKADAQNISIDALRGSGGSTIIQSITEGGDQFNSSKLKEQIEQFKSEIRSINPNIDLSTLNTVQITVYGEVIPWEQATFVKLPIPLVIFNLNRIELAAKTIESTTLNKL